MSIFWNDKVYEHLLDFIPNVRRPSCVTLSNQDVKAEIGLGQV